MAAFFGVRVVGYPRRPPGPCYVQSGKGGKVERDRRRDAVLKIVLRLFRLMNFLPTTLEGRSV